MKFFLDSNLTGKRKTARYDAVVVGGGLAGVCAAIAAARHGCRTAVVQDRPVLGGNSSSEVRICPVGACSRETGIIEEMLIEERARNHDLFLSGRINSIWDMILYESVRAEKNLTLYLNTRVVGVEMDGSSRISAVLGVQSGSERLYNLYASLFVDCTGDGTVGAAAKAEYRMGRESREEFGESLAPKQADRMTQGSSLLFRARDVGRTVPFKPPSWAEEYPTEESLHTRRHGEDQFTYVVSRDIDPHSTKEYAGYWWIEVGAPFDTIDQNEEIRDELLRHVLGVWDHIKNHGDHRAENMAIDWIGSVVGKRESRRLMGDHILTEHDVRRDRLFPDRVAYGGWFIDVHTMGGILAKNKPPVEPPPDTPITPYSIPLRCLYSKNIGNLLMAGRNISVTHIALGSTRTMLTCAVVGQAAGTGAALCAKEKIAPRTLAKNPNTLKRLQQDLLKDDCFIPGIRNQDPLDLAREASVEASSSMLLMLEPCNSFSSLELEFSQIFPVTASEIRTLGLFLNSTLDRKSGLNVTLMPATNVWSFNEEKQPIASSSVLVPPRFKGWVHLDLDTEAEPGRLYQVNISGEKGLFLARSKPLPGTRASYKEVTWKSWHMQSHVYALRLNPPSRPFGGENVLSGVARAEKWTNIWISDPDAGFPQTLTLDFGREVEFNTVYLTFDTRLHSDTRRWPPLHKVSECISDYALRIPCEDGWKTAVMVRGNYHRRRRHHFENANGRRLMFEAYSTNGSPTARLYEMRVYRE